MSNSSWNSLAVISINNISPIIVQMMVTSSSTLKTTMILSLSNTWTMTLLLNKIFTLWTIKQKCLSWNSFLGSNYQFLNNSSPVYSPMKRIVLYSCVVAFHNFTQKMTIWQEKMTIWQEIFFINCCCICQDFFLWRISKNRHMTRKNVYSTRRNILNYFTLPCVLLE